MPQPERHATRRILHVLESFGAGVFEIVRALANAQAAAGDEVHVAFSAGRAETPADWRATFAERVAFHELPMERNVRPIADLRAAIALRTLVRRLRPTVLHLHSSKAGALGRLATMRIRDVRVVYTPHGLSFLRNDISPRAAGVYRFIEWLLARRDATVVAVSESELEQLRSIVPARRLALVRNGIDHRHLDTVAPIHSDGAPRVGMAGRIAPQKGPGTFAAVARQVRARRPDVDFVWIGDGPDRALLHDGDESPLARITGWLPRDRALRELKALDVYLHTSAYEGLPVTMLEAMALRKPVVATDVVGSRDLIAHGHTGFLERSVDALAARVMQLLDDDQLRGDIGARARDVIRERFGVERMCAEYLELYDRPYPRAASTTRSTVSPSSV